MKLAFYALVFFCSQTLLFAQKSDSLIYPEVGKPMPDFFLQNIKYYPKRAASLRDFRGKWLLLDFWSKSCNACFLSFPHTNIIQKELGDQVQVMLVGMQDKEGQIEPMYAKFKERQHLIMPCAFDSALADRFDIYFVPHSIVIDDKGIVQSITTSVNVSDMREFIAGRTPPIPKAYRRMSEYDAEDKRYYYNPGNPFLVNNNGGKDTDFVFRTVLSSWNRNFHYQSVPSSITQDKVNGRFQVLGVPLAHLFNFAYFGIANWDNGDTIRYGKYCNHPILEVRDSSQFNYSYKYSRNIYCYSLIMPPAACTEAALKSALQRDLTTYFGFEAAIETHKCPYWKLAATRDAYNKLKTKGGATSRHEIVSNAGLIAHNWPFGNLIRWVRANHPDEVFFDETGIVENVDITLDCIPTDLDDLKSALKLYGLDLVKAEKDMKVVVIRDKKEPNSQP